MNPNSVTMQNAGSIPWYTDTVASDLALGATTGTCDSSYGGYPAPDPYIDPVGSSCSSWWMFSAQSAAAVTLQHSGSFTTNPTPIYFEIPVQVTVTVKFWRNCIIDPITHVKLCTVANVDTPTYSAPTNVAPGSSITFPMTSMVAPGTAGSYTETWKLAYGGMAFGAPFTKTISVGPSSGTNGSCGTANGHTYASTDTGWGLYTFCSAGTVNPSSPAFPAQGGSTSWQCAGSGGGTTASCLASRASASGGTIQVQSVDSTTNTPVSASWQFASGPQDPCNGLLSACSGTGATYNNMATGPYTIQAPFSGQQKPAGYTFGGV
ncbi:MAG TPA: hypothetical protein VNG29_04360, partial [Candidatus Paceibacterota bacterium]|nr:hypothetical protein [Candidatus Paceibacterota bacterium]